MLNKIIVSVGILSAAHSVPAQAQEYPDVNFNIGGGVSAPLNPTGRYAGASGNFVIGAGYNIDKKNSLIGEFMWSGLPPSRFALHPINAPSGSANLYSGTTNYRFQLDGVGGSAVGIYVIGGGGVYYRRAQISKTYVVPDFTVCQPIYSWWGYTCEGGLVPTDVVLASSGSSAGGINAGAGLTIRINDMGWKFYVEARYHYAWNRNIPTTLIPVTFGFRFN